jgi:hypothetical protein
VVQVDNRKDTNRTQNFVYDELNRVERAWTQAATETHAWGLDFGYDPWANLLSATVTQGNPTALSQSVGTNNQLLGYSYDAAENLTADGSFTYQWDAESRIQAGAGVTYTYDGDGRRVKTQAALPNEGAVLRVFFGLWINGQMKLRRIKGYRDIERKEKAAAQKKIS